MKIKKVILVRHGDYEHVYPYGLNVWGKMDIPHLAIKLIPELCSESVAVISSKANRAAQSAEMLIKIWNENGLTISIEQMEKYYELWSGTDAWDEVERLKEKEGKQKVSMNNVNWLYEFIQSCDKEILVVVCHMEIVSRPPPELGFAYKAINTGHARILNLEIKEETII